VSPAEVERCLLAHPDVAEAAVAERAGRDEGTSVIKAYVVPREGCDPQESDLLAFCAEHLAAYKRPRAVVRLEHLPRNANGKLLRGALP
jgi:acyl-coenzyme A synthetase/AMP-(fatty) acid ligase